MGKTCSNRKWIGLHRAVCGPWVLALLLMVSLSNCRGNEKKPDSEAVLGIWRVNASLVAGQDVGDGKSWFDFKSNGTVDTRPRPGVYDSGTYTLDAEKKTITLKGETGSLTYNYTLEEDKLNMTTTMPNEMKLELVLQRVDDYPITQENDLPGEPPIGQPGE
ncbi:MAG: hypothetical protein AAGN35_03730 [Bacteroidota bacterium]